METAQQTSGLTDTEAARRKAQGQSNQPPKTKGGSVWAILAKNLFTLFNLLNAVLALLLALVGSYRNMLFLGVVVSNTLIGTVQELRAKRTHDKLVLLSQGKISCLRGGRELLLPPQELVLGDVITLHRGDQVPADAKVLTGEGSLNESMLTGESDPVPKDVGDTILSGSFLTSGVMTAELTAVGENSYAGKLQLSARKVKRPHSVLMKSLQTLIRYVSISIVPVGVLLFCKQYWLLHTPLDGSVTRSVAAVLGMIPEGLILLTSVALAVGVVRLGRKNTLVNELYGIETLARTDVICLDKTGTLTRGEMKLENTLAQDGFTQEDVTRFMLPLMAAFQQDSSATLDALAAVYHKAGEAQIAPTQSVAFSSARKWSAARFDGLGTLVMGAPEMVLGGFDSLRAQAQTYAGQGYRVMALLRSDEPLQGEALPDQIKPVALFLISDAVREEAAQTLEYFTQQGVSLKVISGDSALTVSRVARKVGLENAEDYVDMSSITRPADYDALAKRFTVFGRVSPEDKRELVLALKRAGKTVGMIGDGVNDIPALKTADCSIAIAGGSDAARRVAQLTLLDGDFTVMPDIVAEGRRVINNIERAAALFMVKNIFSGLLALLFLALPYAYPFAPIQLTLISTLTIGMPTFFLALEPSREKVKGSFLGNVFRRALPGGLCVTLLVIGLILFKNTLGATHETLSTLCTLAAGASGVCVLILTCLPLSKMRLALCIAVTVLMTLTVLLFPQVFYLTALTNIQRVALAGCVLLCAPLQVGLSKLIDLVLKRMHKKAEAHQSAAA